MYICLCHAVTDTEIIDAMSNGADNVTALMNELKVATQCGGCLNDVTEMVQRNHHLSGAEMPCETESASLGVQIFSPAAYS